MRTSTHQLLKGVHSFSKINVYNKTLVSPFLQRKCKHCEEEEKVQRKEDSIATSKPAQSENFTASLSGGRPLSKSELNFFGSRMGYDFRHVRLHTGKAANESARSIGALAYTHGNDVVFANHQYKPETKVGQRLLAHELTHVIQQGSKSFGTQFYSATER